MKVYASQLKWRKDNPERIRFLRRRWNHEHRKEIQAYRKKYRKLNAEKSRQYWRKWYKKQNPEKLSSTRKTQRKSWVENRYSKYRLSAKDRNHPFEITKELFETLVSSPCYYCGFSETKVGVDRKDNTLGYTTENCLPCCKNCNKMKGTLPFNTFLELCRKITDNRNQEGKIWKTK